MNKRIIILIVILFSLKYSQFTDEGFKELLVNRIDSIIQTDYRIKQEFEENIELLLYHTIIVCDYNEKECNSFLLDENYNKVDEDQKYIKFDDYHNFIKIIKYDKKLNKTLEEQNFYKNNLLVNKREYKLDKLVRDIIYDYDFNNNLIKKIEYDTGNEKNINEMYTYQYDENNNIVEKSWYNRDGKLNGKYISKYDYRNNLIEDSWYNSDGENWTTKKYKYDSNNNMILKEYTSEDNSGMKDIYRYDSNNNLIEEKSYLDGNYKDLSIEVFNKYDSNNNLIEVIRYVYVDNEIGYGSRVEYKYDSENYFIEKSVYTIETTYDRLDETLRSKTKIKYVYK